MLTISGLYIYPIKSLGGISVDAATITSRGLQNDRRWMLIDANDRFLTQREFPEMALVQLEFAEDGLKVYHKKFTEKNLSIPYAPLLNAETIKVQIWDDICEAQLYDREINGWFSEALKMNCRLVYMPDTTGRMVDDRYANNNEITSFSDAYPILLIGQASLDDLNSRLAEPLPMNRFRPNIVFTNGEPFEEDSFAEFSIGAMTFFGTKLCSRCVVTTINQSEATKGKEPLKTLATYRMKNNKIYFGQNLLHAESGEVKVGDSIEVRKTKGGF
ncbi:MAG: hypothetical protein JWR72_1569 [Flavisolibacter sp.]|nr:hypothetical protein [Flavisolibacter sp.]